MFAVVELSSFKVSSFVKLARALRSLSSVPDRSSVSISRLLMGPSAVEKSSLPVTEQPARESDLSLPIFSRGSRFINSALVTFKVLISGNSLSATGL